VAVASHASKEREAERRKTPFIYPSRKEEIEKGRGDAARLSFFFLSTEKRRGTLR